MPYDGNGNYTLPPVYKATPGTEIITTQHNMPLEDIQAALNAVLLRNGSAPITGNWNMGTNRITFLADGVANADAANVGQLKALLNNTALTGVPTVPAVTDWTAYQPVGAKDADARYARRTGGNTFTDAQNITGALNVTGTITALAASSTQKVTFRRASTYGGINSYDGSNWHPLMINDDDTASTAKGTLAFSKDALNPETAEGRYVKSVPATGQTRITDLVENSDGRAVFGDGANNTVLALLADLPIADPTIKLQIFTAITPHQATGPIRISFPTAFKAGTVPKVVGISGNMEGGGHGAARTYCVANATAATNSPAIDNTGFYLDQTYLDTTVNPAVGWSPWPGSVDILVAGEMP